MKLTGNKCECPSCLRYFNSDYAFSRHRKGSHKKRTRHCVDPESVGLVLGDTGFWMKRPRLPVKGGVLGEIGKNQDPGSSRRDRAQNAGIDA